MFIRNRDESLARLSAIFDKEHMKKVITQGYSDISLSVMADFKKEYAAMLVNSRFSADSINKLTEAYSKNKINSDDLFRVVDHSAHIADNEPYIDDFLKSVDEGVYHTTAAKIFAALNYEDNSYAEALDFVKSGAFYPTEYSALSVTKETAEQLFEMGVPLRGCQGFNNCYDVWNLKTTIEKGDAVFVQDKYFAETVHDMMKFPDWETFRDNVKDALGDTIAYIDSGTLIELHDNYIRDKYCDKLYEKVNAEYQDFISEIKKENPDVIVKSAYEIVWKENISLYCEENTVKLSPEQFEALLSSKNTLDEVYQEWCDNGELSSMDDIRFTLERTADKIKIARDRDIYEKREAPKVEAEQKSEPAPEQGQTHKTKKSRR